MTSKPRTYTDAFGTFTNDPADVISVVWFISSESVADYDDEANDYVDSPDDAERMQRAIDALAATVQREYPNVTELYIADGGYENQFASMSPRCETASGAIYEPFFDDMTAWEDNALTDALNQGESK